MSISNKEDQRIIEAFLSGSEKECRIINQWISRVVQLNSWGLKAYSDDITQDVMIKLYNNLKDTKFRFASSLNTYVSRITKFTCIDYLRKYLSKEQKEVELFEIPSNDDPHIVALVSSRLKSNQYEVVVAYDAAQTMAQVRKEKPDLIILDMKMPAGGGNSVLDNLKMSIGAFNTPVLVMTAYPSEAIRQKALEMGATDFITKPFKSEEILTKVKNALGETDPEESRPITKKILVVDDNPNIVKLLEHRLKANEYEVVTAYDGEDALDKVRQAKPDLMILDVVIPKIDGYRVLSILRADEQYKDMPVVMLSAHGQAKDVEKGMELGAVSYITKPFKPEMLLGVIKEALVG